MTDIKHSEDLREELFFKHCSGYSDSSGDSFCVVERDNAKLMLDEYFTTRCKEMLEWMADNDVECGKYEDTGKPCFKYKGGWIDTDQLFQNFL